MSQSATARERSPHARPAARRAAPAGPRRVSGPVRRVGGAAVAGAGAAAPARRTTSAFDRVAALPDHRLVDTLLRSSAWIWVIGIALGGIVAMQVSLLKLNSGIGRAVESAATLERQNATLELSVARLASGRRVEDAAAAGGMVMPPSGSVEYVRARPGTDARWAASRMQAPSPAAAALMANAGVVPGSLIDPAATAVPGAATPAAVTAPAPTEAVAPATAPVVPDPAVAPATAPVAPAPAADPAAPAAVAQGLGG